MADYSPELLELFAQIGIKLKAMRESKDMTVQQLSARTRINAAFLHKIEAGDLAGLPGLAFVKGFIRNYTQVLEISDEELEADLQRLKALEGDRTVEQLQPKNPYLLETDVSRVSLLKMGMSAALVILVLWAGFLLFRGSDEPRTVPTRAQDTGDQPTPGADSPPAAPSGDASPSAAQTQGLPPAQDPVDLNPSPRAAGPLQGRQKLELTLRGLERTWVRVSIDRAPPIDVLMDPADTLGWEANQEIRLTIGKSHGVAVYLNGEEIILPEEADRLIPNLVLNKLTLLRLEN